LKSNIITVKSATTIQKDFVLKYYTESILDTDTEKYSVLNIISKKQI